MRRRTVWSEGGGLNVTGGNVLIGGGSGEGDGGLLGVGHRDLGGSPQGNDVSLWIGLGGVGWRCGGHAWGLWEVVVLQLVVVVVLVELVVWMVVGRVEGASSPNGLYRGARGGGGRRVTVWLSHRGGVRVKCGGAGWRALWIEGGGAEGRARGRRPVGVRGQRGAGAGGGAEGSGGV